MTPSGGIPTQLPIPPFAIPVAHILPLFVTLVFIIWVLYTIVAFYHWLRYGDSLTASLAAMAMHLVISGTLALFAVSGIS